tara:strand:- start:3242 stop:4258 length:1017 start_codon:yes stop_codon:yes gene_type:complete
MTNKQSNADGTLSEDEMNWLLQRAAGDFGIITTAATHVTRTGQGWEGEMGIWSDHHIPNLTKLTKNIRSHGALSLAQIFHGGMRAPQKITGVQPISASVNECEESNTGFSRAATPDEIEEIIQAFTDAAVRCSKAGFDGVEIHGAHGYLISQFLGKNSNRRDDSWGGDLPTRSQFLLRIIQEIKKQIPTNFLIGVRISPEYRKIGIEIEESLQLSELLISSGIDFLHISCWDCFTPSSTHSDDNRMITERFAEKLKEKIPIISTGAIWSTSDAKKVLEQGADLVGVGRVAIGHADWARHIEDIDYSPIRPPYSPKHLIEQGLSEIFIDYMRNWKGFVE